MASAGLSVGRARRGAAQRRQDAAERRPDTAARQRGGAIDRRLLAQSRQARVHLALACLLGAISAALIVAQASLLAYAIDRAAVHRASLPSLTGTLTALGAVLVARAAVGAGFDLSGRLGAVRVLSRLRGRLVERLLLERPADWAARAQERRTGELAATAVQGVDSLQAWFAGYLPQLVLAATVPLAVCVAVGSVDLPAAAILMTTAPLLVLFMILIGKRAAARTEQRRRALSLLSAHFLDVVRGLPELRAHRRESAQAATIAGVGERYREQTMATLRVAFLSALVLELCAMIGIALVAATVGLQLVDGALSLQAGLTVLLLAPEMYGPLREVGKQFHAGADGTAAAARIFDALGDGEEDRTRRRRAASGARHAPDPGVEPVRLSDVCHRYPGRALPTLDGLHLTLRPGEVTALTGSSGAGKSTVASLLLRLIDPTSGTLWCGDADLLDLDRDLWRRQIAWVPQRPTIFDGTVAENIALATPGAAHTAAGRRRVAAAAALAQADALIDDLPQGLDTLLGEQGRRLSAGQARRIALARAFMRERAGLLILDEPTAHLDPATAIELAAAIQRLAQGRTTLLISHDEGAAAIADRVVRLEGGALLAPATPAGAAR